LGVDAPFLTFHPSCAADFDDRLVRMFLDQDTAEAITG